MDTRQSYGSNKLGVETERGTVFFVFRRKKTTTKKQKMEQMFDCLQGSKTVAILVLFVAFAAALCIAVVVAKDFSDERKNPKGDRAMVIGLGVAALLHLVVAIVALVLMILVGVYGVDSKDCYQNPTWFAEYDWKTRGYIYIGLHMASLFVPLMVFTVIAAVAVRQKLSERTQRIGTVICSTVLSMLGFTAWLILAVTRLDSTKSAIEHDAERAAAEAERVAREEAARVAREQDRQKWENENGYYNHRPFD
jgi:hypothetical protein